MIITLYTGGLKIPLVSFYFLKNGPHQRWSVKIKGTPSFCKGSETWGQMCYFENRGAKIASLSNLRGQKCI